MPRWDLQEGQQGSGSQSWQWDASFAIKQALPIHMLQLCMSASLLLQLLLGNSSQVLCTGDLSLILPPCSFSQSQSLWLTSLPVNHYAKCEWDIPSNSKCCMRAVIGNICCLQYWRDLSSWQFICTAVPPGTSLLVNRVGSRLLCQPEDKRHSTIYLCVNHSSIPQQHIFFHGVCEEQTVGHTILQTEPGQNALRGTGVTNRKNPGAILKPFFFLLISTLPIAGDECLNG